MQGLEQSLGFRVRGLQLEFADCGSKVQVPTPGKHLAGLPKQLLPKHSTLLIA